MLLGFYDFFLGLKDGFRRNKNGLGGFYQPKKTGLGGSFIAVLFPEVSFEVLIGDSRYGGFDI